MTTKLMDFIDFQYILDNMEEIIDDDTLYIKCRSDNVPYYIDYQMEKLEKKKFLNYAKQTIKYIQNVMIEIAPKKCSKLVEKYLIHDEINSKESAFYKIIPYYLFYFRIETDENTFAMTAIINSSTKEYIIVGSGGENFYIHTNKFSFGDSSGIATYDYYMIDPELVNEENAEHNLTSTNADPTTIMQSMINTIKYLSTQDYCS